MRKNTWDSLGSFFSHRAHGGHGGFKHTVSSTQKAFGIQRTQSVSAIVDTDKEAKSSLHPPHMGISVITPLPFGGGVGGGAAIFLAFVCSVHLCSLWEKICHSSFVIMSFCLKNHTCLAPSLCYFVFKTNPSVTSVPLLLCLQNYPVSLCHYVILSKKVHLSSPVPLLFCLQDHPFCYLCPPVILSLKLPCLPLSLCHSV